MVYELKYVITEENKENSKVWKTIRRTEVKKSKYSLCKGKKDAEHVTRI
jgi:hypothetical protein